MCLYKNSLKCFFLILFIMQNKMIALFCNLHVFIHKTMKLPYWLKKSRLLLLKNYSVNKWGFFYLWLNCLTSMWANIKVFSFLVSTCWHWFHCLFVPFKKKLLCLIKNCAHPHPRWNLKKKTIHIDNELVDLLAILCCYKLVNRYTYKQNQEYIESYFSLFKER